MEPNTVSNIITALIPVLAPLAVTVVKKGLGDRFKVLLPVICSGLGVVIDLINYWITGVQVGTAYALALGAAGVAVRELIDQLKKAGAAV